MIPCYYKDISDSECTWKGSGEDLPHHLKSEHEVLSYSGCKHNKIVLELVLDLDSSGYRFVILDFKKEELCIPSIFEEYFDETDQIFKIMLRSFQGAGMVYNIGLHGKNSCLEFSGNLLTFGGENIEKTSQCLQIHQGQLRQFCYLEYNECRYKVVISLI
jgi:hypothetical protein